MKDINPIKFCYHMDYRDISNPKYNYCSFILYHNRLNRYINSHLKIHFINH